MELSLMQKVIEALLKKYPGHKLVLADNPNEGDDQIVILRTEDENDIRYVRTDKDGEILFEALLEGRPGVRIFHAG